MMSGKTVAFAAAASLCFCTPAPVTTKAPPSPLEQQPLRLEGAWMLDGICDVHLRAGKVRAVARLRVTASDVDIALIDELGVPLAEVGTDTGGVHVSRFFPPLGRETAADVGTALRAYGLVSAHEYNGKVITHTAVTPELDATVYASESRPDSLVTTGTGDALGRAQFMEGRYVALRATGDTLLTFMVRDSSH